MTTINRFKPQALSIHIVFVAVITYVLGVFMASIIPSKGKNRSNTQSWTCECLLSTHMLGYGIAGLLRQSLVYPSAMLYPNTLPNAVLLQSLHRDKASTKKRMTVFNYASFSPCSYGNPSLNT